MPKQRSPKSSLKKGKKKSVRSSPSSSAKSPSSATGVTPTPITRSTASSVSTASAVTPAPVTQSTGKSVSPASGVTPAPVTQSTVKSPPVSTAKSPVSPVQPSRPVCLISTDKEKIVVDSDVMAYSSVMNNMIQDLRLEEIPGMEGVMPMLELPVPILASHLKKIVEWCRKKKEMELSAAANAKNLLAVPDKQEKSSDVAKQFKPSAFSDDNAWQQWQRDFILSLSTDDLILVVQGANYLDISELLSLGAKGIADLIRGKSIEELRAFFKIENDLSPEEEQRIKEDNSWLLDTPEAEKKQAGA